MLACVDALVAGELVGFDVTELAGFGVAAGAFELAVFDAVTGALAAGFFVGSAGVEAGVETVVFAGAGMAVTGGVETFESGGGAAGAGAAGFAAGGGTASCGSTAGCGRGVSVLKVLVPQAWQVNLPISLLSTR